MRKEITMKKWKHEEVGSKHKNLYDDLNCILIGLPMIVATLDQIIDDNHAIGFYDKLIMHANASCCIN